ncbi:uncharacterized protein PG998_003030 [Apiospora kogelbergensis]|uniref:uncharacterized protein n=1 Tax=Apiospora kogelbergensis TaxID=1337665 RepID=UPI00313184F6
MPGVYIFVLCAGSAHVPLRRSKVVRRVGGADRICERCKTITDSYDTVLGVQDESQKAATGLSFSMVLAEASDNSQDCWHRAWIAIFESRAGKVDIGWHTIPAKASDHSSPPVERLVILYATSEEALKDKAIMFSKSAGRP